MTQQLNQLGHALSRIIHAFVETENTDEVMMRRSLWQNGISKMGSGACVAKKVKNGTLCKSSPNIQGRQSG